MSSIQYRVLALAYRLTAKGDEDGSCSRSTCVSAISTKLNLQRPSDGLTALSAQELYFNTSTYASGPKAQEIDSV